MENISLDGEQNVFINVLKKDVKTKLDYQKNKIIQIDNDYNATIELAEKILCQREAYEKIRK